MSKRETRVAIMTKGCLVACFALDINYPAADSSVHAVGMLDPRCKPAVDLRSFETPALAEARFYELMAKSRDNGWTVAYRGPARVG